MPQGEGVDPRETVDGGVDGVQGAGLQGRDGVPAQIREVDRHRDYAQLSGVRLRRGGSLSKGRDSARI